MKRHEIPELENKIEGLMDNIKKYGENTEDGVEKRKQLSKMQIELGKMVRRLRQLKGLVEYEE